MIKRVIPYLFSVWICGSVYCALAVKAEEQSTLSAASDATSPQVTERGPNHRVWSTITLTTNFHGIVRALTNVSYTELATGLHFLKDGVWTPSDSRIQATQTGGASTNGAHQVRLLGNLNAQGAVDISISEGTRLRGHILGLSYFDTASGDSVMIADIKDCTGEILPPGNRVLYRDAFDGVAADVLYVNSLNGFEQLVILREQPPSPGSYGFNPETTVLEVITEFLNPPTPVVIDRSARGDTDQELSFGNMRMLRGKAFALGAETNKVSVKKQWLLMEGRHCLIEQVPLRAAEPALRSLPHGNGESSKLHSSGTNILHRLAQRRQLPPAPEAKADISPFQIAAVDHIAPGFVVDYDLTGVQTNVTLQGGATYFVSGSVSVLGNLTIEGGAVVKFAASPDAAIVATNVICKTAAYRPCVFTAKDDNTVGETISGSTGFPTNYYGGVGLDLSSAPSGGAPGTGPVLSNLRFCYLDSVLAGSGIVLSNVQMVSCNLGFQFRESSFPIQPTLFNVLLANIGTVVGGEEHGGGGDDLVGINVTAHNCSYLMWDQTSSIRLTNCLFAGVTNWQCATIFTNSCVMLSSDVGVFQTVGAASHYLTNGSPARGCATTNILPGLLAELATKTTQPPIVQSNTLSAVDVVITPSVPRDTGTADIGYHYDPIDVIAYVYSVTNATVLITNGAVVGYYDYPGLVLQGGTRIISQGSPVAPNRFVSYHGVQETPVKIGTATPMPVSNNRNAGSAASGYYSFTEFSRIGNSGYNLYELYGSNWRYTDLEVNNCWFYGGIVDISSAEGSATVRLFNNVFVTPYFSLWGDAAMQARNNLFKATHVDLGQWGTNIFLFRDNAFDACVVDDSNGDPVTHDHNAFIGGTNYLSITNTAKVVLSNFVYETGPLGHFYQQSTNLIDQGAAPADVLGLYHYTTRANQVKETDSQVDIGYHYVALDGSNNPFDINGDGIADYLETNSPVIILTQPTSQTVTSGANVSFGVVAAGTVPLRYQWRLSGVGIPGATKSSYTITNVLSANGGDYSVIVSNTAGTVTSATATLVVNNPVSISSQPTNQTVIQGRSATFSAAASGTLPLWYQWYLNGTNPITGGNSDALTKLAVVPADAGSYRVVVTNAVNSVTSSSATLTVIVPPLISQQPVDVTAFVGSNAVFSVILDTNTTTPVGYQWRWNGKSLASATSSSLTLTNIQLTNVGYYSVVLTNAAGTNISIDASLTATILATNFTNSSTLRLNGHAAFTNTGDGRVLQLTPAAGSKAGSTFCTIPISLASNASFSTFFSFKLSNSGGGDVDLGDTNRGADGIVFVVQTLTNNVGTNGGGMGYYGLTNSVGVEFDTWWNNYSPTIDPLQAGGTQDGNHVGIDYNGFLTNAYTPPGTNAGYSIVYRHVPSFLNNGNIWYAWIDYDGANLELRLSETNSVRPASPYLTNTVNILNFLGTTNAYLGFTAATGGNYNQQDILSWQFISPYHPIGNTNLVPTVSISSPTNNAIAKYGTPVLLTATASEPGGAITNVQFFNWTTNLLGTGVPGVSNSFYFAWTNAPQGTNALIAVAKDYRGSSVTSSPAIFVIVDNPPVVSAGTNWNLIWTEGASSTNISLAGSVSDDGLPYRFTNTLWTVITSNGAVTFSAQTAAVTTATFSTNGIYLLQLAASDGAFAASNTCTVLIKRRPLISIISPTNGSVFNAGNSLGLAASASDFDGVVTNVRFFSRTTNIIATIPGQSSAYSATWTGIPHGTNLLTAVATDNDGLSTTSAVVTIYGNYGPTVNAGTNRVLALPVTNLTLNGSVLDDGIPAGAPIPATWSVVSSNGPVSFGNIHATNSSATFVNSGVYVLRLAADDGIALNSDTVTITVNSSYAPPSVTLISPTNNQLFVLSPTNILLTAIATNAGGGNITGVAFYTNGSFFGQASYISNQYQVVWQNVLPGTNIATVWATNDSGGVASVSATNVIVNAMPVISITNPTNSTTTNLTTFNGPTSITITGNVADLDGEIARVEVFAEGHPLGFASLINGTNYSFAVTNLNVGVYPIYTIATDDRGASTVSSIVVFRVKSLDSLPTVTIVDPSEASVFPAGSDITITALATNNGPPIASITNVQFFVNGELIGEDHVRPYTITRCCWPTGKYTLVAMAMDDNGGVGVSEKRNIQVGDKMPASGEGYWDPNPAFPSSVSYWELLPISVDGTNVYIAPNQFAMPSLIKWDGTSWEAWHDNEDGGYPYFWPVSSIAFYSNTVYVAGQTEGSLHVINWNGVAWQKLGGSFRRSGTIEQRQLVREITIAWIGGDLYAGGAFDAVDENTNIQYLAKYNFASNAWESVGDKLNGPVFAICSLANKLVVGGVFTGASGNSNANCIAQLEGNHWRNFDTGIGGTNSLGQLGGVFTLAACGSNLYLGGDFSFAGGNGDCRGVAVWDGLRWQSVGRGVSGYYSDDGRFPNYIVFSISPKGDSIYVAGKIEGGIDSNDNLVQSFAIARASWSEEGQTWFWSDLDLGANFRYDGETGTPTPYGQGMATAIVDVSNHGLYDLYVTGPVSYGTRKIPSSGIARWRVGSPPPPEAPQITITAPHNLASFTNDSTAPIAVEIVATTLCETNATKVTVEFFQNGVSLGSEWHDWNTPFTNIWNNPPGGFYLLTATVTDGDGHTGRSQPIPIQVDAAGDFTNGHVYAQADAYELVQNSPTTALGVLDNDTSTNPFFISQLEQPRHTLGVASIGHDGRYLWYTPVPHTYGVDRFRYRVTNNIGAASSAWVTVTIRPKPVVEISQPEQDAAFMVSSNVAISVNAFSYDASLQITNIFLIRDGTNRVMDVQTNSLSSIWMTNRTGFYSFRAVATDSAGNASQSDWTTIRITNALTATNALLATIDNLPISSNLLGTFTYTVVRDGLFSLQGKARDPIATNAVSYQLLLARPEDNQSIEEGGSDVTFANVTPGLLTADGFHEGGDVSNTLGVLDFTSIPNGVYDLVLIVRGGGGQAKAVARFQLESQLKIGQFGFSEQDLSIPVNGIPLTVMRTYNSLNSRAADFGYCWSYSLFGMDVQLDDLRQDVTIGSAEAPWEDDESEAEGLPKTVSMRIGGGWDVTLTLPDGRRTTFTFAPTFAPMDFTAFAHWQAPAGVYATLEADPPDARVIYTLPQLPIYWAASDTSYTLSSFVNHDIPGWVLQTRQDGIKYYISRGQPRTVIYQDSPGHAISAQVCGPPKLRRIVQPSGDEIWIDNDRIYHKNPLGAETASLWIDRDSAGRITAIHDPMGGSNGVPAVKYVYNRDTGNLIQVLKLVDRISGTYTTNKYHYDNPNFPHYITSIEDPRGVPLARNLYDDAGRLVGVVDATGKTNAFVHNIAGKTETVTDRMGHTTTYGYDTKGNVTTIIDPLNHVTQNTYDDNNNLTSTIDALTNKTSYGYDGYGNQIAVTNALNQVTRFTYFSINNALLTQVDSLGNLTTNSFDGSGNLTDVRHFDALGNLLDHSSSHYENGLLSQTFDALGRTNATFVYDTSGNLKTNTDANGLSHTFGYDDNGNQTSSSYVFNGTNVTSTTEYDALGRVTKTTDPENNSTWTYYTPLGKVDHTVDKLGNTNSFLYDVRGNLIQTVYPDNLFTRTVYDDNGRPYITTDRNNVLGTLTEYDGAGRVTNTVRLKNLVVSIVQEGDYYKSVLTLLGTGYSTNSTEYFNNGWVKSRTGADGHTTSYTYWADGQTKTVTDPRSKVTYYEYDEAGRQKFVADALSHTNRFVYDGLGRNVKTIFADNSFITNIFNLLGQNVGRVDQASVLISNVFDVSGQLTSVVMPSVPDPENSDSPGNPTWNYGFDQYGRQISTTDAKNRVTTNGFDQLGRLFRTRLPRGETNWIRYNSLGQVQNTYDFKGQRKESRYDRLGRVATSFWFAAGASTPSASVEYYYDVLGRLTNITERSGPGGNIQYSMRSNERTGNRFLAALARMPAEDQGSMAGVLLSGIAVLLLMWRLKFDIRWLQCIAPWLASQNLTPNPRRLTRGLRLRGPGMFWQVCTAIVIICLLGSDPRLDFWSAHAECANPTNSSSDDVRLTYFDYDLEGHLKQVNCPEGVINYGYDEATGRHVSTCTANNEVGYQYDELGRLEHVTVLKRNGTVTNEVTTYMYTDVGSRASVIFPNGVITTNRYDSLNRLTNVTHSLGGTNLLASYSYGLHSTGRRTNAVEILKLGDNDWQTNTLTWNYDAMYRLTNEVSISSLGASGTYTNSYRYDKVGNRLSKTHYQNGVTTLTTNSFNENDQLRSEITLTNSVANVTNLYAYDANGSLISKTNIASGGMSAALYGYDLKNKLTGFTNYPAAGLTVTASYVYNDQGIRVRSTENGSPRHYLIDANNHTGYAQILEEMATAHSTATLSYIIGDDVLAQAGSGASSYFLYDGHGSTRQLANSVGVISSRYNYDAYGNYLDTSSSSSETTLKYCGEQFDASLGMYNLRARFYNPENGRFSQRDSFKASNFDPQSLHKYAYCHGDPFNGIDPSGRSEFSLASMAVAGLISAGLDMGVMVLLGERNYKKVLVHGLISGVFGALSGPVLGAISEILPLTNIGWHFARMLASGLAMGAIAAIQNILTQSVDKKWFHGNFDWAKVQAAFFIAFIMGSLGDLMKSDSYADDEKAEAVFDYALGVLSQWVSIPVEAITDWFKMGKAAKGDITRFIDWDEEPIAV